MVHALTDIRIRDFQLQRVAGAVETRQTVFGDGGLLAVDKRNAAVALGVDVAHQLLHAPHVVGNHGGAVIEYMVDGHHRELGIDQLQHLRVVKINAGDYAPVHPPVLAVL